MEYTDLTELGIRGTAYAKLMHDSRFFAVPNPKSKDIVDTIKNMHRAISNIEIVPESINDIFIIYNPWKTDIINSLKSIINILKDVQDETGEHMEECERLDRKAQRVFQFCNNIIPILDDALQNLEKHKASIPAPADQAAIRRYIRFKKGKYGNIRTLDFINKYIIDTKATVQANIKRLNFILACFYDEQTKDDIASAKKALSNSTSQPIKSKAKKEQQEKHSTDDKKNNEWCLPDDAKEKLADCFTLEFRAEAKFKDRYNYFNDFFDGLKGFTKKKDLAAIALRIYDSKHFIDRANLKAWEKMKPFSVWLKKFFGIIGMDAPKNKSPKTYVDAAKDSKIESLCRQL